MPAHKPFSWKIFFVLWIAAVLSVIAVLPYALTLQEAVLQKLGVPLAVLIPLQILQNAIVFAIATAGGLWLANRVGLGAPILEAFLAREKIGERLRQMLPTAILLGVVAGGAILLLDLFAFAPLLQRELGGANPLTTPSVQPPAWQGLLASFYGGIGEEIFSRLFLFSLFAFIVARFSKTTAGKPTRAVFWIVNLLIAILFGLGHLPATAVLVPLTPLVIARAVLLNGIPSLAYGYLYWTRGLEAAMVAHFSSDLVLHVLAVFLLAVGGR
ncbi:MAG: CPBP family intramembrane metalloprotease [Chloroflexi bacterium]|nr:CPBP family intramembrane metalloprotease [Chloroflexota bacterium]